jgi:hypothetical protein
MITVYLMGGLGNILFQVSIALVMGKKNRNKIKLFRSINNYRDKRKNIKEYKMFEKMEIEDRNEELVGYEIIRENNFWYNEDIVKMKLERNRKYMLYGYFQSYKYIIEEREYIKSKLENKYKEENEEYIKKIKSKYGDKKIVSIHIRRGDYLRLPEYHYNLSERYYRKAIKKYEEDETVFIIFSDDVEYVKKSYLMEIKNREVVEDDNEERSLWLMSECRDGHILANSSYSWWGDYLNENKEKEVCCPLNWFGEKGVKYRIFDIFPILEKNKYGKYYLLDDK